MRIIEVLADCGHADTIKGIAEQHNILDCWVHNVAEEERCSMRLLVRMEKQQKVLDALQQALGTSEGWRIMIKPVEGVLPRPPEMEEEEKKKTTGRSREELYSSIEAGARLDATFLWLVIFSTIVAAIGLNEDNVAVVIGAMVIAPLLGPNIALAFGAALGDRVLIWRSLKTSASGLLLAFVLALVIGLMLPVNLQSHELITRTDVNLAGVVLALVSGAAGVLSLTTGLSSTLVGVMVAVALLPPTATIGLMLASKNWHLALGAALLLAINVVCVNLSAKLVLILRGVKPRTWLEKTKARQSMVAYIVFWVVSLGVLLVVVEIYHSYFVQ